MVELLVSVLIGMLALMFVMRSTVDFEKNRRSGIGGSDSMQNGVIALFSMENDAAQAGWGLNDTSLLGCPGRLFDTQNYANGNVAGGVALTLSPVTVVFNGANPDQISFFSGTSDAGAGSVGLSTAVAAGALSMTGDVNNTFFKVGDVLAVAPPVPTTGALAGVQSGPCAIAQVSSVPVNTPNIGVANDGTLNTRFNPTTGLMLVPAGGFLGSSQSKIFNLGQGRSLAFHTWDVNNGVLRLRATDLSGASNAPVSAVSGIVSIKALYGFDTRAGAAFTPDLGLVISQWSAGMLDANADGLVNSLDYQRLGAIRIAVVARSRQIEKLTPGHTDCSDIIPANAALPTVFSNQEPANIATVPLQVNVAVAGDAIHWSCYHYRIFETIVPLRNSGWKPG